ncbi:MAG: D-2-hydroxyacid dehydrogenase, partial [Oscillospiraceae bacterium]|nr:D-2-hydroxyacid dehydrogenase [Oscillospiraceae bacterium]
MKIVILDGYTANPGDLSWEEIARQGELTVYDRTAPSETVERIGDAEVVFTNKVLITKDVMDACPKLRLVSVLATGYNVVDLAAAKER